jgi:trk system potassium uptake protein TrkH
MFIGGCMGSTGSSIKVGRILVLLKQAKLELVRCFHPHAVFRLKIDGKSIGQNSVINTLQFFFLFLAIAALGTIIMTFWGFDLVTSFTAIVSCLGNIGPGLALVGPIENFGFLPDLTKYFLSFLMLLGRLEIYTVLVLFLPSFWRKG